MNAMTPAMIDSAAAGSSDDTAITHFEFQHQVFKTPGARFLLNGQQKVPTFRVEMGDIQGLIEIPILRKEFKIDPESHDAKLIDLAIKGLRYVPDIKPQDSIPSELLSGKASWAIANKHKMIAEQRLQVQLLSWVSGKEMLITDPKEIESFLGQIENREKLRTAFREAAEALGFGKDKPEMVVKQLELLARELCYIEALRDRYALVPRIMEKLVEYTKSFGNDRNAKMELARVKSLLQMGINEYTAIFTETDAQTGEIIAALKSIDRQIKYIRDRRDTLHFLLMEWEPHIKNLPLWRNRRTSETDRAQTELYRFLAPRFSSGHSLLKRKTESTGAEASKSGAPARASYRSPAVYSH